MKKFFTNIEEFETQLEKQGGDFICHTRLPDASASVSFLGSFQGRTVLWNMTLATLAHYRDASAVDASNIKQEIYRCPFIEINAGVGAIYPIGVGLDLEIIDGPAIKKTIIMIRNYKRLVVGKIEFCGANT